MTSVVTLEEVGQFRLTQHARERATGRGIALEAVWLVLQYGRPIRGSRGDRYSLEGICRPPAVSPELWCEAVDVVVPVDRYGWIPTVFRTSRAGCRKRRS